MKNKINLFQINLEGDMFQIHIGYQYPLYFIHEVNFDERSIKSNSIGGTINIIWEYKGNWIRLKSESDIFAYPTIDMRYIVAIYQDNGGEFPVPNNAVIYNLDGSIHKILEMPKLISVRLQEEIKKNKHSNPPLEAVPYETGLQFSGFGWDKDKEGNIFNYISIKYLRDYSEGRELNPETGEIGRLVDDWYNYY